MIVDVVCNATDPRRAVVTVSSDEDLNMFNVLKGLWLYLNHELKAQNIPLEALKMGPNDTARIMEEN